MKNLTSHKVRSMFMIGGVAAMMGVTMIAPRAAHADKEQNYKIGATALGILGAVLAVKGKTLPAVIAGAGAYYAYEKGKDAKYEDRYDNRWNDNRYDNDYRYNSNDYYGNRYDNNNRYDRNNNRYDRNDNRYYGSRYDNNNNRYNGRYYSNR